MRDLKGNSNINETSNNSLFKERKQQRTHSKNAEMAFNNNGGQQQNMEVINMISYIEQTRKTLKKLENTTRYQSDPIGHVINLSKKSFTKGIFQLLNKNINFTPTPKVYNKDKLNKELESFYRLLKLKANFKDNGNTTVTTEQQIFKPQTKEKWTPNKNHHNVLIYIEATQTELEKEQTTMKEKPYNNLTKNERTSMKELSEREDIIITKADKGGAAVFVDVKDYIKEAEQQLNNTKITENFKETSQQQT